MTQSIIAMRYGDDWVLVDNYTMEQFRLAPAPTASQVLLVDWTVVDV